MADVSSSNPLQRPRDVGNGTDPIVHTSEVPAVADNDQIALGNHNDELPLVPKGSVVVAELVVAVGPPPVSVRRRGVVFLANCGRFAYPVCWEDAPSIPLTSV
jgi:hypothetical protein